MSKPIIYLAGPIQDLAYKDTVEWRNHFSILVGNYIHCLSPMRGKDYLKNEVAVKGDYPEYPLSCARGINTRDFFDCNRADLVVANLLGAKKASIGTVMEIAWAYAKRTPVVVVMEKEGNPHDHGMLNECTGFRVERLEEAAHLAKLILWPVRE